jgi:regulatory subunit for Cdc7p protein kinase
MKDDKKERKTQERVAKDAEFRVKYTKAFPSFRFFLDRESVETSGASRKILEKQIQTLGGVRLGFYFIYYFRLFPVAL